MYVLKCIIQGCRKVVKSGGATFWIMFLLVVPYTLLGGSGGMPPRKFLVFLCSETAFSTI